MNVEIEPMSGFRNTTDIRDYERVRRPKDLIVVDGSANAQFLFETDQSTRVLQEILQFLARRAMVTKRSESCA